MKMEKKAELELQLKPEAVIAEYNRICEVLEIFEPDGLKIELFPGKGWRASFRMSACQYKPGSFIGLG